MLLLLLSMEAEAAGGAGDGALLGTGRPHSFLWAFHDDTWHSLLQKFTFLHCPHFFVPGLPAVNNEMKKKEQERKFETNEF